MRGNAVRLRVHPKERNEERGSRVSRNSLSGVLGWRPCFQGTTMYTHVIPSREILRDAESVLQHILNEHEARASYSVCALRSNALGVSSLCMRNPSN